MARLMLKNPYFNEEIKVKESYEVVKNYIRFIDEGNMQFLPLNQIEPEEAHITISPKCFAKIEVYGD